MNRGVFRPDRALRVAAGLALVMFLLPAFATAQSAHDNFIELQVSTSRLDTLLRSELQSLEICPEAFECPGGGDCVLDHVEFPPAGRFRHAVQASSVEIAPGTSIPGIHRTEFVHPIEVFVKTADCVEDPDCGAHEYLVVQQIDLVTAMSASMIVLNANTADEEIVAQICAEVVGLEPNLGIDPSMLPDFSACSEVPLDAVADLVDEAPLRAAALTVNDDETHVAVRLGFHTGALDAAGWTDFLEGDIAQPETPSDLGIIVDKEVFVDLFKGFVNPAEISKVNSDGPPTAYWWPLGDTGVMVNVITPIEVEVPVCPDIDGDIFTDFLVNFDDANDEMVVDAFFDYDLSEWDKFACSALSTFFDPFNAAVMGGIINGLAGVFAPDAGELQAGGKVPSECQVTGEKSFQCKFPVSLPDIRFSGVGGPRMGDILPRQSRGHPGDPLKAGLTGTLRVPCAALQAADGSIELQLILPAVLGLLMLDVLLDDFFVSTHCRNEVAARPEVLPAEVPPNRAELSSDLDRALPLDIPIACATECFGGIEIMM